MDQLLTRGTVWLALILYVAGEIARWRSASGIAGRYLNTSGCALFIAHVACAFHFYHDWSHSAAYADTARQTSRMVGWGSGAGLYINYLFAAVWLVDAAWSWINLSAFAARSSWITRGIRGFFWFMIFNGAVLFAQSPTRWLGLLLGISLIPCWWPRPKSAIAA